MNCERIQEWILTDYLDGELSESNKNQLERHLHGCNACRLFLQTVKQTSVDVFKDAKPANLPDGLWDQIESRLIEEQLNSVRERKPLWQRLGSIFTAPSAVVVWTSIVLLGLFVSGLLQMQKPEQAHHKENTAEYLMLVMDSAGGLSTGEFSDLGTSVEMYFL